MPDLFGKDQNAIKKILSSKHNSSLVLLAGTIIYSLI